MLNNPTSEQMPAYYPLMVDIRGRKCVVVGGGEVARRKVEGLLAAGASVTVVAPTCVSLPACVEVISREFAPHDLDGAWLVIAATADQLVNADVAAAATARHIWVNAADDPLSCTAILPAVVRRGLLCLTVSTSGASPVWARRLRDELAVQFGAEYCEMAKLLWEARQGWKGRGMHLTPEQRKRAWEAVLELPLLVLIRNEQLDAAKTAILSSLEQALCEGEAGLPTRENGEAG